MSLALKEFRAVSSGFAISASLMTSACATSPLLPKSRHINEINPQTCIIDKADSFKRGIILSLLLPFVPDTSKSNTTRIDQGCSDRRIVESLLAKSDPDSRAIAVAAYDQLSPVEKQRIDQSLKARGTSMDKLGKDLPRVIATNTDQNCATIRYQLPGENNHRTAVIFRCADNGPAIGMSLAPS